ncbi:hypothetical protein [Synechocystis sp. PCC 6714]|uniref:hypothetical protein n=1 Tax=Synechocystis sp. (strain PCC 6714) TaxID=1147 RepID=UPI00193090CB|nr:hypothetical protein [Synechocystis sp. PCC 6714]
MEIAFAWSEMQSQAIINHPEFGKISPNDYRARFNGKVCPFCAQRMVHGQDLHMTRSRDEAISRKYQYADKNGNKKINNAGGIYYHPHYVTLDHVVNKARCPELMFKADNLQIMCWKCNVEKGDNNSYEIELILDFTRDIAREALERYKPL